MIRKQLGCSEEEIWNMTPEKATLLMTQPDPPSKWDNVPMATMNDIKGLS